MSTIAQITGAEFDAMVLRGAFECLEPKKVELIHGELRLKEPAGPLHDDLIDYLTRWSTESTRGGQANRGRHANIRVQSGFVCDDHRPEPEFSLGTTGYNRFGHGRTLICTDDASAKRRNH